MNVPITPPLHLEPVTADENARVVVDANGHIVCLTSTIYAERLVDVLNAGFASLAVN